MIGKKVLASAISLTVLFVAVEAENVAGSIRGEEGRELVEVEDELWKKGGSKKGKSKGGGKGDKGGRCESSKSMKGGGYRRELGYYKPPPPPGPPADSKICKVFDFLDYHYKGGRNGNGKATKSTCVQGRGGCCDFDDAAYCHLIDTLHPGFNDKVCPCKGEKVQVPKEPSYRYSSWQKKYYDEKLVCPSEYERARSMKDQIDIYGYFCAEALGFEFMPFEGHGGRNLAYPPTPKAPHDDDNSCFVGCRKYVKLCCCEHGDSGNHYYD